MNIAQTKDITPKNNMTKVHPDLTAEVKTVGGPINYQATPNASSYGLVQDGEHTISQSPN
jgi:hypothetical protein